MASVGDVLSDLELRVLQMKVQVHIRNLQRTGVTGKCVRVHLNTEINTLIGEVEYYV